MSADQDSGSVLPVRTNRYRRTGRHSSPHQLSLPSDSPALVIAVPGSARPESEDIAVRVADMAAASCHGAEILIGFLRGNQDHLEDVLGSLASRDGSLAGVVVPLLAFPNPEADEAIFDAVAAPRRRCSSPITWARIHCSPRHCMRGWPMPAWPGPPGWAGSAS